MSIRGLWLPVAVLLTGFAVSARAEAPREARPSVDQCGRAAVGGLIGLPVDDVATVLHGRPYGVVTERHKMSGGLVVTGDYRPERLSLVVDRGGRVAQVLCG
jgi:hypothetical protein